MTNDSMENSSATKLLRSNGNRLQTIEEVPVLIVGGGPCGLLQAYLLSRLNIKSLVIERYHKRLSAPKAHALSPRSLEICRQSGLDTAKLRTLGTSRADAHWVNFVTSLSGEHVGRLPYERMDIDVLNNATPEMIHNIPQPMFEDFLYQRLKDDPNVQLRKSMSFSSCEQPGDYVISDIEDRTDGSFFKIQSRHVIACDGSRSKVREALGIAHEGDDGYETMMTIHFNADLRPVLGDNVGILHWILDPEVSGFIIGYDISNNQVLICNFDSEKNPVAAWHEDMCRQTITAAIGRTIPFNVLSFRPWVLSRKVAKSYRAGNVLLAGDAAHSFPPTGGLGLNSGIADVHNIAYKIAAVHHGWAKDTLLDSYEADRRHVAQINSEQSLKNGDKILGFLKAMGATDTDKTKARENLHRMINDPSQTEMINEQIEGQREHFDNLGLHIGYVYGDNSYPINASNYTPKYCPGARLPHAWISLPLTNGELPYPSIDVSYVAEFNASDIAAKRFSTLDLCKCDAFTLILGHSGAETIAAELGAKIAHKINVVRLHKDFELIEGTHGTQWIDKTGLERGEGLLVRPDQHILAVVEKNSKPEGIVEALCRHLGLAAQVSIGF